MARITVRQRRRLKAGISAEIRRYQRCLPLLEAVDQATFEAGMELFEREDALALWLCAPARSQGGKVPLRVLRTKKGQAQVTNALRAIAHGVYL